MTANLRPEERRLAEACKLVVTRVISRSDRLYDIRVEGICRMDDLSEPVRFSAWLPLAAIRALVPWRRPEVARMTDYPEMVLAGDWSGVRDSSDERIWRIFEHYVMPRVATTGVFKP